MPRAANSLGRGSVVRLRQDFGQGRYWFAAGWQFRVCKVVESTRVIVVDEALDFYGSFPLTIVEEVLDAKSVRKLRRH